MKNIIDHDSTAECQNLSKYYLGECQAQSARVMDCVYLALILQPERDCIKGR